MSVEIPKQTERSTVSFTPGTTAKFMASMFDIDMDRRSLKVLDAGAGSGILSVALISRMRESGYNGNIHLVCYENELYASFYLFLSEKKTPCFG